jgi:hypothetical protein
MDLNRDEIRRQLREAETLHREALGPWRRALDRLFSGEEAHDVRTKSQLVGVPDRRQFIKVGGATVIGAAVLAACSTSGSNNAATTGTTTPTTGVPTSPTTAPEASADVTTDKVLLRTATSIELLSVDVYDKVLGLGILTTPAIQQAAKLFRDQHNEHAALLQGATTKAGGVAYRNPNSYLSENVVTPALPTIKTEADAVKFARELENVAASTYTLATGILGTSDLRQALMSIGGVEARHVAVLNMAMNGGDLTTGAPNAFQTTTDSVGSAAYAK